MQNSVAPVISFYFESQIVSGVWKDGTDSVPFQLIDEQNEQRRIPCQPIRATAQQHVKAAMPRQIAHPFQAGALQPQSASGSLLREENSNGQS